MPFSQYTQRSQLTSLSMEFLNIKFDDLSSDIYVTQYSIYDFTYPKIDPVGIPGVYFAME